MEAFKAVTVEIAKIELKRGDMLVITPPADFRSEQMTHLHALCQKIKAETGAMVIIGQHDIKLTVVKAHADEPT